MSPFLKRIISCFYCVRSRSSHHHHNVSCTSRSSRSNSSNLTIRSLHSKITQNKKSASSSSIVNQSAVQDFLEFISASPSPFHAVAEAKKKLIAAGFKEIKERQSFENQLEPKGKYFFTRNQSAIIAFVVGGKYVHGNGLAIIGAHTDSPCLKVKPRSKKEKQGYNQVGVECYGGGLWHTWFDRDLGLAGRVIVANKDGSFEHRLVRIHRSILRIPTLAIHLDRGVNDGFSFNKEVQLTPVLALSSSASQALNAKSEDEKHSPVLLNLLAKELNVDVSAINDFELCLYDTTPGSLGGAHDEFIFSARLDNLCMSYCSLQALINSVKAQESVENDPCIRVVALFDNEEVGSVSTAGADSNLMLNTLKRLAETPISGVAPKSTDVVETAMLKSFLISADMAHAIHPNYPEKHEENHRPAMNKGIVIKQNANQRYATTSVTTLVLREAAKKRNSSLQEFVVRNDSPCGSTIGPMLSAKLGIRTVDVGNPQLSMHSIREQCGSQDIEHAINLFESFFEDYAAIDARIKVD